MALTPPKVAWELLEKELERLPSETIPRRQALGRVLASELEATVDIPPTDVSAMDGYAVDGAVAAGDHRAVSGLVAAGDPPGLDIEPGAAVRIMTGAPTPPQSTAVVPVEQTDRGTSNVHFTAPSRPGAHIRRRGEVLRTGSSLLAPGCQLTPAALSLLATHGVNQVAVHRLPEVAFLTTGDEIVPPDVRPGPGQLRDSHTDFLLGAGKHLGLDFHHLGIAPDDPGILKRKITEGLVSDVLMVCGGVSQGEFDFVESILEELDCRLLFDAVAIQPGKPLVAARHDRGWIFGLPGNPASVMVTFRIFVRPLLRRLMGLRDGYLHDLREGVLTEPAPAAKARDLYVPAEVEPSGGALRVRPVSPKGSHDQVAYARGTALIRIPAGTDAAEAGDTCEVLPL